MPDISGFRDAEQAGSTSKRTSTGGDDQPTVKEGRGATYHLNVSLEWTPLRALIGIRNHLKSRTKLLTVLRSVSVTSVAEEQGGEEWGDRPHKVD